MGKKITTEDFIHKAMKIHKNKYDYSKVNYTNNYTKIIIICPIHNEFEQIPFVHLQGSGCKLCSHQQKREAYAFSKKEFIKKAKEVHGNKYDYSKVNYVNIQTKIIIICPTHGGFKQIPNAHLRGAICIKCSYIERGEYKNKTTEEFIKDAEEIHGNRYNYSLVNYIGANDKIKIICPDHGIFKQKAANHTQGQGCPNCKSSRGELKIKKILENNDILFQQQKRFKNCRDKKPLPFDFYIPNMNTCIEYDGEQHSKVVKYFGGNKGFEVRQKRDIIKNEYCKKKNIRLLRIRYDQDVKEELSKLFS